MILPAVLKRPTAYLPLLMSGIAILIVVGHVALHGPAREIDEGTAAHLWQLLMAGQLPLIALFAFMWLPQAPRSASAVLLLQIVALLAAAAPVYFLAL
jgi:hypothetical protein